MKHCRPVRPDCQSAVSGTPGEDDWSWRTRGNLILICAFTDDDRPLTGGTNMDGGRAHERQKFSLMISV